MDKSIKEIRTKIQGLKKHTDNFISVSNSEWYTLFKDEIRNSIAIEGVFANRNELLDVLERNKRTDKQKTAAILGYFESASAMYEYANNQLKEKDFYLRMVDIKQIHTLLMRYEKEFGFYTGPLGEFRKEDVEVTQADFKPISGFYVRSSMELFIKWFNRELQSRKYNPIELAAISHIWFETIHPHKDGNGRSGRILLSYILIGTGFVNISIKGINKTDREKYYDALQVSDGCFQEINRRIERGDKISVRELDKYISNQDFSQFVNIIKYFLEKAFLRLKHAGGIDFRQDVLIPLRELAVAFDYSRDYLRNLINRGKLKAVKKGKLWYVRIRDMQKYIDSLSK